jgi:RNA polymerase sigma-70 factor, ECF subfamily
VDDLAQRFEAHREHLRAVALRMLGSSHEADDAVQEAWLRLSRTDVDGVDNLAGWLTTVVSRVCLDMLRARARKPEAPAEEAAEPVAATSPEDEALLAESVGMALLVVLDTLAPAERLAFVLHDMFGVPFDAIAPIVDRSPAATRQLATRARRRVHQVGAAAGGFGDRHARLVTAFQAASREGNFDALLAVLDPDAEFRADTADLPPKAPRPVRGARGVADVFCGKVLGAELASIDGRLGLAFAPGGKPRVVFEFTTEGDRITVIDLITDAAHIESMEVVLAP